MKIIVLEDHENIEDALKAIAAKDKKAADIGAGVTAEPEDDIGEMINKGADILDELEAKFESFVRNRMWIHVMRDLPESVEHADVFVRVANTVVDMIRQLDKVSKEIIDKCIKKLDPDDTGEIEDEDLFKLVSQYMAVEARIRPIGALIDMKMDLLGFEYEDDEETEDGDECEDGCCHCGECPIQD